MPAEKQVTAERGRAIAVDALKRAGHHVNVDALRASKLTARQGNSTITVFVATRRGLRYPFWLKTDWHPADDVYACLVRLPEGAGEPEVYLIPTREWEHPDGVLVSRDYEGRATPPEWGINLSGRNLPALSRHLLPEAAEAAGQ
jgi:hypothetical protein